MKETMSSLLLRFSPYSFLASTDLSPFPSQSLALAVTTTRPTREKKRKHLLPRFNAQLSDFAPAASAVYGTLLFGGGLFAYTRSGSKGSLLGGLSGAILMAASYFLMQVPESKDLGDALGFGSAFLFSSVFGIRLAATRKLVPSGPLLALSVCALVVFVSAYLQDRA